jgi:3-hydroxymyristoyl/3-hydroxydecanoyl-(acyl carrier protein) dehydratase
VLLEAALQPCGWLALANGAPLRSQEPTAFRNLDGNARVLRQLPPGAGTLVTRTTLRSVSRSGGMTLLSFDVACSLGGEPVLEMQTGFGFFPDAALASQAGLPADAEAQAWLAKPGDPLDLERVGARAGAGLPLWTPRLSMLDRITGSWPEAGRAGLGRLRGEKDVDPGDWFFKAHFFQDPVQPGSLGLEALLQLLRVYAVERGLGEGMRAPRFEPAATLAPLSWKYRGQVRPQNRRVAVELEVTAVEKEAAATLVRGEGWLWVDGTRIYAADLALRVRETG